MNKTIKMINKNNKHINTKKMRGGNMSSTIMNMISSIASVATQLFFNQMMKMFNIFGVDSSKEFNEVVKDGAKYFLDVNIALRSPEGQQLLKEFNDMVINLLIEITPSLEASQEVILNQGTKLIQIIGDIGMNGIEIIPGIGEIVAAIRVISSSSRLFLGTAETGINAISGVSDLKNKLNKISNDNHSGVISKIKQLFKTGLLTMQNNKNTDNYNKIKNKLKNIISEKNTKTSSKNNNFDFKNNDNENKNHYEGDENKNQYENKNHYEGDENKNHYEGDENKNHYEGDENKNHYEGDENKNHYEGDENKNQNDGYNETNKNTFNGGTNNLNNFQQGGIKSSNRAFNNMFEFLNSNINNKMALKHYSNSLII